MASLLGNFPSNALSIRAYLSLFTKNNPMPKVPFKIVNVFTSEDNALTGNALAVFLPSEPLATPQRQAIARQFNLSESTFLQGSSNPQTVLIHTPTVELPFAGHPTLGSAAVAKIINGSCIALNLKAGLISVSETEKDVFQFRAPLLTLKTEIPSSLLSVLIGLEESDIIGAFSCTSAIEQILIEIVHEDKLWAASANLRAFYDYNPSVNVMTLLYVLKPANKIVSRFFFREDSQVIEDPGTGSACANLGNLFKSIGKFGYYELEQGHLLKRICKIGISVTEQDVYISGRVTMIGEGSISI
jgi:trans-2,3-dihydro-3-hydroxyanthranilate isomerase